MKTYTKFATLVVAVLIVGEVQFLQAQLPFPVPLPKGTPRGYRGFMPSFTPTPPNDNTGTGLAGVPPTTIVLGGNAGQAGGQLGQIGGQLGQIGGQLGQIGGQLGQGGGQLGQIGGQLGQIGGQLGQIGGQLGQGGGQLGQI